MDGRGACLVVGVDGTGRTHRLEAVVAAARCAWWLRALPTDATAGVHPLHALLERHGVAVGGDDERALGQRLARALCDADAVLAADDVHWLHPLALTTLAEVARAGAPMAVAHRPAAPAGGPDGTAQAMAALDEALASRAAVVVLSARDGSGTRDVLEQAGASVDERAAGDVHERSGGYPALAVALAVGGSDPLAVAARVERRLSLAGAGAPTVAAVLATAPAPVRDGEVPFAVVAEVSGLAPDQMVAALDGLHACGLLAADREHLVPAVGEAVVGSLAVPERRRLQEAWAVALLRHDHREAAVRSLRDSGSRGPQAAALFLQEAERARPTDPTAAAEWLAAADAAGAQESSTVALREELSLVLGRPAGAVPAGVGPAAAERLRRVAMLRAVRDGRWDRAIEASAAVAGAGLLVVPGLVATGDLEGARRALAADTTSGAERRTAEACVAALEGEPGLARFVEAAEVLDADPAPALLPDTPHALGALVATAAGDPTVAEHLLDRAAASGAGGPGAERRHGLVRAWARMRAGRYDAALAQVRSGEQPADARDGLLLLALEVGLARRSGDVTRLRDAWSRAEPVLLRGVADLFVLEPVEELVVAAARLREHRRVHPVLGTLDRVVDRLGRPAPWAVSLAWTRLQVAVASEDDAGVVLAAEELESIAAPPGRPAVLRTAALVWAEIIAGRAAIGSVQATAADLAGVGLPWEGSRLAGQAAIRTTDPSAARRLLEQARELATDVADAPAPPGSGGLTEREVEIARLVVAGRTHKEIGAQLFVAPKTVEHHVARIRTKVGATTRAELLAALRAVVDA